MAERVQADLELMLTELEQMQRVGLLSAEETKLVIKKRKRFEYKLQKQTKVKEDILCYIQYESSLLDLIELRRDKIGYLHKKSEIDGAITKRINQLFRIAEHRFGQLDPKLWITHLAFLKRMDWKVEAGKVLRRFVQALPQHEETWIFAARFEMEKESAIGLARTLLLEGLRFHNDSIPLYREYFTLELECLQKARNNPKEVFDNDEQKEKILNGDVVRTVFESAVQAVKEHIFVSELLGLTLKSNIPKLFEKLKRSLMDNCQDQAWSWLITASLELYSTPNENRSKVQKVEDCTNIILEGLEALKSEEVLNEGLQILQDICEKQPDMQNQCEHSVFQLLEKGKEFDVLNDEQSKIFSDHQ